MRSERPRNDSTGGAVRLAVHEHALGDRHPAVADVGLSAAHELDMTVRALRRRRHLDAILPHAGHEGHGHTVRRGRDVEQAIDDVVDLELP